MFATSDGDSPEGDAMASGVPSSLRMLATAEASAPSRFAGFFVLASMVKIASYVRWE